MTSKTSSVLLLAMTFAASAGEQVIIQGVNVDVRRTLDQAPQGQAVGDIGQDVQDLSDGSTNEGGVPDAEVNLRDAALGDEKNLGPNAPGYIP